MGIEHMACRKASPCGLLPWEAIAESVPEKALWDDAHRRKALAEERRLSQRLERGRRAAERRERQERARAAVQRERKRPWRRAPQGLTGPGCGVGR